MRVFYDFIFLVFSIIYLPYLIMKGKAHKDFVQRAGFLPRHLKGDKKDAIWVHAVSVGEVMAARIFIENLKDTFPEERVILSTTTKTGQETAKKVFSGKMPTFYFPLDFSFVIEKTLNFLNPSFFILFETEIWPNLITGLVRRNIPVILVNGRISDRSFKGYKLVRFILRPVLRKISLFCMQTEIDAKRIKALGAPAERVKIAGNMKYDISRETNLVSESADELKLKLGIPKTEDILIAGSTHKGEEEILLKVYKDLLENFKSLRLVIAPRHVDRTDDIENLCRSFGFRALRISKIKKGEDTLNEKEVFLLDTIGQLGRLYSIGTIVFIGGSLVKRGGHNIIEPARFAKPTVFGPYMNNFRDMANRFLKNKASVKVKDTEELERTLEDLLRDESKRLDMGQRSVHLVEENSGAVRRVTNLIKEKIERL